MNKELLTLHGAGGHAHLVQCFGIWYSEVIRALALSWVVRRPAQARLCLTSKIPPRTLPTVPR